MKPIDGMMLKEIEAEIKDQKHSLSLEREQANFGDKLAWIWRVSLWTYSMGCVYCASRKTKLDAARDALRWLRKEKGEGDEQQHKN